ncbi:MAG: hypothetical protein ACO3AV_11315 [Ilumatobacteraceae bacterium]|jgi:hypothetical protein
MTVEPSVHRALAIEANNSTWDILGRPLGEIGQADAEEMTRRAYAAAYHWERAEGVGPVNSARADWLLAKVWIARANGEVALHHARRCLDVCGAEGLVDFDLAYAHEAMARALACRGSLDEAAEHRRLATAVPIAEADDREIVEADLAAGPWFGLA